MCLCATLRRAVPIPCTAVTLGGKAPTIGQNFVAPSATVAGQVELKAGASVWYGAVVRAQGSSVSIGELSAVHENATVLSTKDAPVSIGKLVTVGAGSTVVGATLLDGCTVGCGCIVPAGASIGAKSILTAGSVLAPRTTVPAGQVRALRIFKPRVPRAPRR
jgi:carbonic anhydrase/acetyltransferase-like protein (isoleucine patch superfamily)